MIRSFVRSSLDADHRSSAYKIVCKQCGKTDRIGVGSHSGSLPPEVSARKFRQRGWAVGNKEGDDFCNICTAANKIKFKKPEATVTPITLKLKDLSKLQKLSENTPPALAIEPPAAQETPVDRLFKVKEAIEAGWSNMDRMYDYIRKGRLKGVKNEKGVFVIAESELKRFFGEPRKQKSIPSVDQSAPKLDDQKPVLNDGVNEMNFDPKIPQEMTKEDRRIIFSEIDSHYLDETRGYDRDWNDERVAKSLNVPLAWVRTIREDNFGPERGNVITIEVEKLNAAKEEIDKSINAMRDLWMEINKSLDAFTVKHNALSDDAKKAHVKADALLVNIANLTRK